MESLSELMTRNRSWPLRSRTRRSPASGKYNAPVRCTFSGGALEIWCKTGIGEIHDKIPAQISETLEDVEPIKTFAKEYGFNEDVFFIGRALDYEVALEGSLKLKEISYIHAEAYAAGELKHGTLALIVEGVPVIALATQKSVYEKTLSNIKEVKARDAVVIGVAAKGDDELEKYVDHVIKVPQTDELLIPLLTVVPLQLLAYYAAITRGCDVDKPRNLAKSVTVE